MSLRGTYEKLYAKVIVKAWKEPKFKKKLLSNPKAALEEMGIEVPEDIRLRCVEDTGKEMTLVLPEAPKAEINDNELLNIAAAGARVPLAYSYTLDQ